MNLMLAATEMSGWDTMIAKIVEILPEVIMMLSAFVIMIVGLSKDARVRQSTFLMTFIVMLIAGVISGYNLYDALLAKHAGDAISSTELFGAFMRFGILAVSFILLLIAGELPDELSAELSEKDQKNPGRIIRGEFFGLYLLSVAGAMVCAAGEDLVWLFLALELTSLPTYVLVAVMRNREQAPEAAVKYFYLGAFSAAIFLYGFALIYGATGSTKLPEIQAYFINNGVSEIALAGILITIFGLLFKIAAFPMHFYVADVYQGAATPVTAMLGFVPKAAGLAALVLVINTIGWPLTDVPVAGDAIWYLIAISAVLSMFAGNTLALRQTNIKRTLAYSSVAHSGYMMVGLLAGSGHGDPISNGLAAAMYYVMIYGIMNGGAFAVIGMLKRKGEEAESFEDLRGLVKREPLLATAFIVCVFSLAGIPPVAGFLGKLFIFGSAVSNGFYIVAILGVVNSAIAAVYYLWMIRAAFMEDEDDRTEISTLPLRGIAAVASAFVVLVVSLVASPIIDVAAKASDFKRPIATKATDASKAIEADLQKDEDKPIVEVSINE